MKRSQTGFTLIEAIAAVAIMAIVMGAGVPSFKRILTYQRVASGMSLLSTSLASARMAAISAAVPITVCPITAGSRRCRQDSVWDGGWMVFRDRLRKGQPRSDKDVLQVVERSDRHLVLWSAASRKYVRFQADGRAGGNNLIIRICSDGKLNGEVAVNNVGRVRSRRASGDRPCGDRR